MSHANVSSCVLSIIASFTSGLDVFKNFRETRTGKKRRTKKNASIDDEERRLVRSLRQGPEDIGREYQRSIQAAGQDFANGDAIAQTCLAEVLLKLNTGLVSIINTFLAKSKGDVALDYRSLTRLSEDSRVETCKILRQLLSRMMQTRVSTKARARPEVFIQELRKDSRASSRERARQPSKVRGPTIARVVIADSSRPPQVAMVRPGNGKKKSHSSLATLSKSQSKSTLALPAPPILQSVEKLPELPARPAYHRTQSVPSEDPRPRRKQSAIDLGRPSRPARQEVLRASKSTSRLNHRSDTEAEPLPPLPNTTPLPAFNRRTRKETPTYHSMQTNSTRLGEIPLHKWAEQHDFDAMSRLNREAEKNGWPWSDLDNTQEKTKRGLGIFRLFRRNRDAA